MFDDFLEGIGDIYKDVDGFFSDLSGGVGVLDVVKKGVEGYNKSKESVTGYKPNYINSIDEMKTEPSGVMGDLDYALGQSQAIKSEDATDIMNDWYSRIYQIATGEDRG